MMETFICSKCEETLTEDDFKETQLNEAMRRTCKTCANSDKKNEVPFVKHNEGEITTQNTCVVNNNKKRDFAENITSKIPLSKPNDDGSLESMDTSQSHLDLKTSTLDATEVEDSDMNETNSSTPLAHPSRKVYLHVCADEDTKMINVTETDSSYSIGLKKLAPYYWRTNEPVECSLSKISCKITFKKPQKILGVNTYIIDKTITTKTQYIPKSNRGSKKVEHYFNWGIPSFEDKTEDSFLSYACHILRGIIHHGSTERDTTTVIIESIQSLITHLKKRVSYRNSRLKFSEVVNSFLQSPILLSNQQLQLILATIGLKASPHLHCGNLLDRIKCRNPPSNLHNLAILGINEVANLKQITSMNWLDLIYWGLDPKSLPIITHPLKDRKEYKKSINIFLDWYWSNKNEGNVWKDQNLIQLLCKFLDVVPDYESLSMLLDIEWKMSEPKNEFFSLRTIVLQTTRYALQTSRYNFKSIIHSFEKCLAHCIVTLSFREISEAFNYFHKYDVFFRRVVATKVNELKGSENEVTGVLKKINFNQDGYLSVVLIENFLCSADYTRLIIYPKLIPLLLLKPKQLETFTRKWVNAVMKLLISEKTNKPGYVFASTCQLIESQWETWNSDQFPSAVDSLRIELLQLHKKKNYGGGMELLAAMKYVGYDSKFISSNIFTEWLLPGAIEKYFKERCIDTSANICIAFQGGKCATQMLQVITDVKERIYFPHELSEKIVLCLLEVLQPALPQKEDELLGFLLSTDQALFWPKILSIKPFNPDEFNSNEAVKFVRNALNHFQYQLQSFSLTFKRALDILSQSKNDNHNKLNSYLQAIGNSNETYDLPEKVYQEAKKWELVFKALQHFRMKMSAYASDYKTFTVELDRIVKSAGAILTMNKLETEDEWGCVICSKVREVASSIFKYRDSFLFADEWDSHCKKLESTEKITIKTLVDNIYLETIKTYTDKCQRILDTDNPLTIREIAHIIGTPTCNEESNVLEKSLLFDLKLIFQKSPNKISFEKIYDDLLYFVRMQSNLQISSALLSFVQNIVSEKNEERELEDIEKCARKLITFGEVDSSGHLCSNDSLQNLAIVSKQFLEFLLPAYKDLIYPIEQIGLSNAKDLLLFVRDLEDDDLRDIIDSSSDDKVELVDAITSLSRVVKILRPILKKPPTKVLGDSNSALELLKLHMKKNNEMTGIELTGHLEACISNFQALTHRNKSMGDQAKASIELVNNQGTFIFDQTMLEVKCEGNVTFNENQLMDLRSHAALAVNVKDDKVTPESKQYHAAHFLKLMSSVDLIKISVREMNIMGHFEAYSFFRSVNTLEKLQLLVKELSNLSSTWQMQIQEARCKSYWLSFYSSRQIWQLHNVISLYNEGSFLAKNLLQYVTAVIQPEETSKAIAISTCYEKPIEIDDEEDDAVDRSVNQLNELGSLLCSKFCKAVPQKRVPEGWYQHGHIIPCGSIIYIKCADVIESCVSLYFMEGELPEHCQLLFCSSQTTKDEIDSFLHRAFYSYSWLPMKDRLFCAIRANDISEDVNFHFKKKLSYLYKTLHPRNVRLALILKEENHHSRLNRYTDVAKEINLPKLNPQNFWEVLKHDKRIMVVSSEQAGLGKTRMVKELAKTHGANLKTLTVSGPLTRETIVQNIMMTLSLPGVDALHIDVIDLPTECVDVFNDILFEILCLSMVGTSTSSESSLVHVSLKNIFLEIGNNVDSKNLDILPIIKYIPCENKIHLEWNHLTNPLVVSNQTKDDVDFVCCYLMALQQGTINDEVLIHPLDKDCCWRLLDHYIVQKLVQSKQKPSFAQIDTFISVLAQQLRNFHISGPFLPFIVKELGHANVRSIVVGNIVNCVVHFVRRSIESKYVNPGEGIKCTGNDADKAATVVDQLKLQSFDSIGYMLLLMQDECALTAFPGPTIFGREAPEVRKYYDEQLRLGGQRIDLVEWRDIPELIPDHNINGRTDLLKEMINFTGKQLRESTIRKNYSKYRYCLTADNCLKMMLIYVRLRAKKPVIVSGETGCGKTSLIKFLFFILGHPEQNLQVLNVHAGVGKERIKSFILYCEQIAKNTEQEVWVFFDEANTSPDLGMISEIICRNIMNGAPISSKLRFLAAVNPYKLRQKQAASVGLQTKLKVYDPMRFLVYRVYPLPQKMLDYVWDYGRLSDKDERCYISNMLKDSFLPELEAEMVFMSQRFIRHEEEECSVSLRDVLRFKQLVKWFFKTRNDRVGQEEKMCYDNMWWIKQQYHKFKVYGNQKEENEKHPKEVAIILALAHSYMYRLETQMARKRYLNCVKNAWNKMLQNTISRMIIDSQDLVDIIEAEQKYYVDHMDIPDHLGAVAINDALLENIFMLVVCIANRIPAILVGKPGCSKTLSLQMIFENLRGKDSKFPHLPCLYEQRYQCSEDSTSDGIEAIFEVAKRKGEKDGSDVTHVVVLDEIGLAECSRHNPLKVLHDRLEPDIRQEWANSNISKKDECFLPYAVVGISNWALDMSKMNRAVIISRPEPSEADLHKTARTIASRIVGRIGKNVSVYHERLLYAISTTYFKFKQRSHSCDKNVKLLLKVDDASEITVDGFISNFHGLRDFYALSKSIGSTISLDENILASAVARNFNGLPGSARRFQSILDKEINLHLSNHISNISSLNLICDNLQDCRARHLMIISRGDAPLCLLTIPQIREVMHDPVVMVASSFEKDTGINYSYQQLSKICEYMMTGRQLVLKSFDNIYGALYDMLNQTYLVHKKRKCRIALGNAAKQVEVHENFRCIIIEEEHDLIHADPPRLNRCEKQRLTYTDVLRDIGDKKGLNTKQLLSALKLFCKELTTFEDIQDPNVMQKEELKINNVFESLKISDAFIGFSEDTISSLLIYELQQLGSNGWSTSGILANCKRALLDMMAADAIVRCESSNYALNPENTEEFNDLINKYYQHKYHAGLCSCLLEFWPSLGNPGISKETEIEVLNDFHHWLLILSFTSYDTIIDEFLDVKAINTKGICLLRIGDFESETTFRNEIESFWSENNAQTVLLLQCDAIVHRSHLILAREIMTEASNTYTNASNTNRRWKGQVIVIHVQRFQRETKPNQNYNFNFASSGWKNIVVDQLAGTSKDLDLIKISRTLDGPMELVLKNDSKTFPFKPLRKIVEDELSWSIRCLRYPHSILLSQYIEEVVEKISKSDRIMTKLEDFVRQELKCKSKRNTKSQWLVDLALCKSGLIKAGDMATLIREKVTQPVRSILAILFYSLETNSALAGLLCCKNDEDIEMWMSVYLSKYKESMLEVEHLDRIELDSLVIKSHYRHLKWPFSPMFINQMETLKINFIDMCAPGWSPERISSMRSSVCLQFISESHLWQNMARHLIERNRKVEKDENVPTFDNMDLSDKIELFWLKNRYTFLEDAYLIFAEEVATSNAGINLERVRSLIKSTLALSHRSDNWHPVDIFVQHWKTEPLRRHALQLLFFIPENFTLQNDFSTDLINQACFNILDQITIMHQTSAWVSIARRCINYACKLGDDTEKNMSKIMLFRQLQVCADYCSCVTSDENKPTWDTLVKLAKCKYSLETVYEIIKEERTSLSKYGGLYIERIDHFLCLWVTREFKWSTEDSAKENVTKVLCDVLNNCESEWEWKRDQVPPAAGIALNIALRSNHLMLSYVHINNRSPPLLGNLNKLVSNSILLEDAPLASVTCAIFFQHFVREIKGVFNENIGVRKRPLNSPNALKEDLQDCIKSQKTKNNLYKSSPTIHDLCHSFHRSVFFLSQNFTDIKHKGDLIIHLSFTKSFIHVICPYLLKRLPTTYEITKAFKTVNHSLSMKTGENDDEVPKYIKALQEYLLKELCVEMSINQLMQSIKHENIGNTLPVIRDRCMSSEILAIANTIGFDPFSSYCDQYNKARKNIHAIFSDGATTPFPYNEPYTLFAVTTALYLPLSITKPNYIKKAISTTKKIIGESKSSISKLTMSLASNNFSNINLSYQLDFLEMKPNIDRYQVCASSLLIHMAGVLNDVKPLYCPFAKYAKEAEMCTKKNGIFVLGVASNDTVAALKGAAVASAGHKNRPVSCACGFMYVIGNCGGAVSSQKCPQCHRKIGGSSHQLNTGQTVVQTDTLDDNIPGYIIDTEDSFKPFHSVRQLPPLSYRVLHLLVHLSLLSGALLGYNGLSQMMNDQDDASIYCWNIILRDLKAFPHLFDSRREEEIFAWLHDLVQKLPQWCDDFKVENLDSALKRQKWEKEFANNFISKLKDMFGQALLDRPLSKDPPPLLHRIIEEDTSLDKKTCLFYPSLFSRTVIPTFSLLDTCIKRRIADDASKNCHPLLTFVMKNTDLLALVQHLPIFTLWEQTLRKNWSSRIDRKEALEMTMEDLVNKSSPDKQSMLVSIFTRFSAAWNAVVTMLQKKNDVALTRYNEQCDCHPIKPGDMPMMSLKTPLSVTCIDTQICSEPAGNLFRLFLFMLSKAQNDFLDAIVSLVPRCKALEALSLGGDAIWLDSTPKITVLKFEQHQSLLQDFEGFKEDILKHCLPRTGYGISGINYDFLAMEETIVTEMLTGTRLIDLDADDMAKDGIMSKVSPSIFLFKGELIPRFKDLPKKLSENILQEPVLNEMSLRKEPFLQEARNCKDALDLLDLVIYHATKSYPSPDEKIKSFCSAFDLLRAEDHVRRSVLNCKVIGNSCVKQLRSLYEIIEDMIAEKVLPSLPETLPDCYCVPLPSTTLVDKACIELGRLVVKRNNDELEDVSLAMKAGLYRLEPPLKRFIYREFKESTIHQDSTLNTPLYYYLLSPSFPWNTNDKINDEEIEAAFPDDNDPTLKHAFHFWHELKKRNGDSDCNQA